VVVVLIPKDKELELPVASPCRLSATKNMAVKRRCFVLGTHTEALNCSSWKRGRKEPSPGSSSLDWTASVIVTEEETD
jgi:hypothetical protein